MLTLYQAEWCPYCHRVRQVLTELELTYTCVNVPLAARRPRSRYARLSVRTWCRCSKTAARSSPAPTRSSRTFAQLYPAPDDAEGHAEVGPVPGSCSSSTKSPEEALALLREAFADSGMPHPSVETPGPRARQPTGLPEGYVLVHAAVVEAPSSRPSPSTRRRRPATNFSLAVFAVDGGSAIAVTRPFAEALAVRRPGPEHDSPWR